ARTVFVDLAGDPGGVGHVHRGDLDSLDALGQGDELRVGGDLNVLDQTDGVRLGRQLHELVAGTDHDGGGREQEVGSASFARHRILRNGMTRRDRARGIRAGIARARGWCISKGLKENASECQTSATSASKSQNIYWNKLFPEQLFMG